MQKSLLMKSLLLSLSIVCAFVCSDISAQGTAAKPATTSSSDTIAAVLQKNVGQSVELHLNSGEKVGGKVGSVGSAVVHVAQVTGMEMFDADVNIADISAVFARKSK
jgi:hypothetical protein